MDNCPKTAEKRPIFVDRVDVNKGDTQPPKVRSRLRVAETRAQDHARCGNSTLVFDDHVAAFPTSAFFEFSETRLTHCTLNSASEM